MNIHKIKSLGLNQVKIKDKFWSPKLKTYREVTIIDSFTKFQNDRGGAVKNYDRVKRGELGYHAGPEWYDGLVNEMIRGASDFLALHYDPDLDNRLDCYITRIAAAAEKDPDGYINTWTQLMAPNHRWGFNGGFLRGQHDVYNAGAIIEAGIHHYKATGKLKHLRTGVRFANHMCEIMGSPPKKNIVPAHSLPEEALVKLYQLFRDNPDLKQQISLPVEDKQYLKLAEFWIENRGNHAGGPDWENHDHDTCLAYIRDVEYGNSRPAWGAYAQDHIPVLEQETIEGHSVRATLMCVGLIAAAIENDRDDYYQAALRLWENMVYKRMHITGGVGAIHEDEKFGPDYYLPNDAYLETCAAVGAGFFHHGMNQAFGDAKYADEVERVLFNNILNGVSLSGDRYYYQNPLEGHSRSRWEWHVCPCCPPMFLKFMGALPNYIYAVDDKGFYINQFIGSDAELEINGRRVKLTQENNYPWDGDIKFKIGADKSVEFSIYIRIPGWVRGRENPGGLYKAVADNDDDTVLKVNDEIIPVDLDRGYAQITRTWQTGDEISLHLPMPVRRVYAHNEVKADSGQVALLRGPMVYCMESLDHTHPIKSYLLKPDDIVEAEHRPDLLDGITVLTASASRVDKENNNKLEKASITAIPFYAQNNRHYFTDILTWLPESQDQINQ
jgi:DUF1680 family protein